MKAKANIGFTSRRRGWPAHGWLGLGLVVTFWILNWSLSGLRSHWTFFPLWLGYCLTVDALVVARKGNSLLTRDPRAYAGLFLVSAPAWWLFELMNWRTQNWYYDGRHLFTNLQYFVLASFSFSTVMPAVFGAAELVGTFNWLKRIKRGRVIVPKRLTLLALFTTGCAMLVLTLSWPRYFFPFVWISVYLVLEPLNVWLGNRSLIYQLPYANFLHVFEMPLLGYGGYIPFSLELFALYHLITGLLKPGESQDFIQVLPDDV